MLARTLEQVPIAGNYPIRSHHFDIFFFTTINIFLGTSCPLCGKQFPKNGPMRRHFEDIHQPGEYPCPGEGCGKVQHISWELKLQFYMRYNLAMWQCKCHNVSVTNVSQVFTSKNKMSSHRSRNCNPNKDRRKTLWESFAVISLWCPSIFQWNTFGLVHFKSYSCPNYSFLPEKVHLLSFFDITFVLIYNFVCLPHSSGIHYNLNKRRSCPCPYIT